jgi:hypothetical protein
MGGFLFFYGLFNVVISSAQEGIKKPKLFLAIWFDILYNSERWSVTLR